MAMSDPKTICKGCAYATEHFIAAESHRPHKFLIRGSSKRHDYLMSILVAHDRSLALFADEDGDLWATGATEAQAVLDTLEEKLRAALAGAKP